MELRRGRRALAIGGAVLLLGGLGASAADARPLPSVAVVSTAVPAGDVSTDAMTRAQARRAYRAAVCPMNASITALDAGAASKEATWASVQALMLAVAKQQLRAARLLLHPALPWPLDVRDEIVVPGEFILRSSAAMEILAGAPSQQDVDALMTSYQANFAPSSKDETNATQAANATIKARLGIKGANCPNQ
jgi:hypothetical protein